MSEAWSDVLAALDDRPPLDPGGTALIVSAHPDDEVVALGSWLSQQSGRDLLFVTATDGEASHPGDPHLTPDVLVGRRPLELVEALRRLGIENPAVERLRLRDGGLATSTSALLSLLEPWVERADLVVAPFEIDGHPDHDAVGQACRALCTTQVLWRYPIWTWEWDVPQAQEWLSDLRRLDTTVEARRLKVHALEAFVTQVEPAAPGAEPVVTSSLLAHAKTAPEVVVA
ncbi:PIG-L deacetylase family protein [Aeromicrobium sp. CF3.5]|uniref:PIG-L deacetylase family protein n=1 Tax=Aeromicrobium sp. CF3.5 TaxID=3373078 RepID=UPI003EE46D7F